MTYRSNLPAVLARIRRARMAGLIAAATVLVNAVKRGLMGGYTTGAFAEGDVEASVVRTEPDLSGTDARIDVGTDLVYARLWELGFYSVFSRKFERKEVWMPALLSNKEQVQQAYASAFKREMGAA